MVRWLCGFSLLSLYLLSFGGAQGSLLLSASMFLSGGITAGPFNSLRTSDDPTPQEPTVNTHTHPHTHLKGLLSTFETFWLSEKTRSTTTWRLTGYFVGVVSWSYAKLNLLNAQHFPDNCCELDKYRTCWHLCIFYFPCTNIIQLATKVTTKMCESGLQMHQVVPGNPQHVLSSHLPALKMPTHWAPQIELLYGQTITLNSLVMGLWCLEW